MKSIFGLDQNFAGALCYLFGWVSGIVVLVLERENKFVRFHALQSTLWFLMLMVTGWVLNFIRELPVIGGLLNIAVLPLVGLLGLLGFISWIILIVKAFNNETVKVPIIGNVAWSQINK